jgi:hypothetical protein
MKKFIKKHKIVTIFVLLLIALAAFSVVKKIQSNLAAKADLLGGMSVQDYSDYMKSLKEVPSDIEGMSQYDKYKKGLDYRDGSDSDYDGLTDKEEIEEYGTDPLKASTAGDLYSDGYKVANGMELFTYCEYDGDIAFEYNECPEVTLEADEPTDLYAVVQDYTSRYSLSDYGINTIYKGFWLYNYNGTVQIDLTSVFNECQIGYDDINVWVCQGDFIISGISELEKCKYKEAGNIITLKYNFDLGQAYYIYITGKQAKFSSFLSSISKNSSLQIEEADNENGIAFIYGSPIIEQFFNTTGHIYYSELDDEIRNNLFLNNVINYCNTTVLGSKITDDDTEKLTSTDVSTVKLKAELFQKILPICAAKPEGEESVWNYLFNYTVYEDEGYELAAGSGAEDNGEEERKYYNNYHTTFDPYEDELPFQNFESEYANGGNCAGISHFTAYLFNTGSFPSSGSYGGISWNLTVDPDNATLMDSGLYDYKSRSFVDDNSGKNNNYLGDGLSDGEVEFVKMIGAYWMESNDKAGLNAYIISSRQSYYDWSLAEKMMDYLNQGKILCVGMMFNDGTGHEVNLYDYYYTDAGELIFRVYDSNIPQNSREGYELNCDGACYLQCKEVIRPDGVSSFVYLYWPINGNYGYLAASAYCLMEYNAFVVTDENWNIFNE